MAGHRYWRIYIDRNNGGADVNCAKLELRESAGGADATGSGTASASSEYSVPTYAAANAFDSDASSFWNSNDTGGVAGEWLQYDFGSGNTKDITEIAYTVRNDGFTSAGPKEFRIRYSDDGSSWTTAWCVSGLSWTSGQTRTLTKPTTTTARYWRVFVESAQSGVYVSCIELEMRESAGGSDVTGSGTASASSDGFGWTPDLAFNNSTSGDGWHSGGANLPTLGEFLAYDFGSGNDKAIVEIAYTSRPSNAAQGAKDFQVQFSADALAWAPRWTETGINTWTGGDTKIFTAPATDPEGDATTAQAQTSDAVGSVGDSGVGDTAQAQTSDGAAEIVVLGGVTAQAQTSSAAGSVGDSGVGVTAQAQTSDAVGSAGSVGVGDTAQAQTSDGAGTALTPWVQVQHIADDAFDLTRATTVTASLTLTSGSTVVVLLNWGGGGGGGDTTSAMSVTDTLGNTYTELTDRIAAGNGLDFDYGQFFVAVNVTGGATTITGTITLAEQYRELNILEFTPPPGGTVQVGDLDMASALSTTSVTSNAFSADANSLVVVAALSTVIQEGGTPSFNNGFTLNTPFAPDNPFAATGYRNALGGLTNQTVTYNTGQGFSSNLAIATLELNLVTEVSGTGSTSQAQTTAAAGALTSSASGSTSQAQTAAAAGAIGAIAVALTGVAAAGAAGGLGVVRSTALAGAAGAGAVGDAAAVLRRPVTGAQAAGTAGAIAGAPRAIVATGVAATGVAGSVTSRRTRAVTGVAAGGYVATIAAKLRPALTGVEGTGAVGTLVPPSGLSGVRATGRAGSVRVRVSKLLSGVQAAGSLGVLDTVASALLSGVSSTAACGAVTPARSSELSGVSGATTVGYVLPTQDALGVSASGAAGSVGLRRSVALTGVSATGAVGRLGNVAPVNSDAVLVSTPTLEVTASPVDADVFIVSSAVQVLATPKDEQVLV